MRAFASGCRRVARRSSFARWSKVRENAGRGRRGGRAARRGELRDFRVGLLHGQMPSREKNAVMSAFAAGETDVLVATTVIEVGVDVPNATVMVIEDAERFGLPAAPAARTGRPRRARLPVPAVRRRRRWSGAQAPDRGRGRERRFRAGRGRPRTARRRRDPRHPPERPAALRRRPPARGRTGSWSKPATRCWHWWASTAGSRIRASGRCSRPAAAAFAARRRRPDPALNSILLMMKGW